MLGRGVAKYWEIYVSYKRKCTDPCKVIFRHLLQSVFIATHFRYNGNIHILSSRLNDHENRPIKYENIMCFDIS